MPLNLPPRFTEELEKSSRRPFALLEIHSNGVSDEATSESDWGANINESNVDYTSSSQPPNAGDVILAADAGSNQTQLFPTTTHSSDGSISIIGGSEYWEVLDEDPHDSAATTLLIGSGSIARFQTSLTSLPDNAHITNVRIGGYFYSAGGSGAIKIGFWAEGSDYFASEHTGVPASWTEYTDDWPTYPVDSSSWTKEKIAAGAFVCARGSTGTNYVTQLYMTITYYDFQTAGYIEVELDLSASESDENITISLDDVVPTGTGLAYTCKGSNATSSRWTGEEVSLGTVEDGSQVDRYDYLLIRGTLSGDGTATPVLKSISAEVPDKIYKYTSFSERIFNAYPYLCGIPGRAISIDLKDFVTLGSDMKVALLKDDVVVQMLRENYFKNLHASIRIGMYRSDITEEDLVHIYQGKVNAYTVGVDEVSITLKDGTKDLSAKWPEGSGTSTPPAVSKDGTHMVDIISAILDDVGVKARYIDRGSLNILKSNVGDGSPAPENYVVYRGSSPPVASGNTTITEPETAKKAVGELLELLGAFMVPQEDGKIHVLEYDSTASDVDTWDEDDFVVDPTYNPDIENLRNCTYIYYDWDGSGSDASDFSSLLIAPDATSITNWDEIAIRIIKSKWLAGSSSDGYYGDELAAHIGARETARRKNGQGIFPCKTSLSKFRVQNGDMVNINMSDMVINPDVGDGDVRKFIVVSKDPDWEGGTISWKLVEAR